MARAPVKAWYLNGDLVKEIIAELKNAIRLGDLDRDDKEMQEGAIGDRLRVGQGAFSHMMAGKRPCDEVHLKDLFNFLFKDAEVLSRFTISDWKGLGVFRYPLSAPTRSPKSGDASTKYAHGGIQVKPKARDAYQQIDDHVSPLSKTSDEIDAVFIQYQGVYSAPLVDKLMTRRGTTSIEILLQHPCSPLIVGSRANSEALVSAPSNLLKQLAAYESNEKRLTVRQYIAPASVCGVRIRGRVIMLSWYPYYLVKGWDHSNPPPDLVNFGEFEAPAILVYADAEPYFGILSGWLDVHLARVRKTGCKKIRLIPQERQDVSALRNRASELARIFLKWHEGPGE